MLNAIANVSLTIAIVVAAYRCRLDRILDDWTFLLIKQTSGETSQEFDIFGTVQPLTVTIEHIDIYQELS
jgi:hypothetical protein